MLLLLAACSQREAVKPLEDTTKPAVVAGNQAKAEPKQAKAEPAVGAIPTDVQTFIDRREGCDHFRGEEGYGEDRARNIREQLETLCTGTDAQLAALKAKYNGDAEITTKLSVFEETIE